LSPESSDSDMVVVEVLGECQQVKCQQENERPHLFLAARSNGLNAIWTRR
jgi:hypothetical protein